MFWGKASYSSEMLLTHVCPGGYTLAGTDVYSCYFTFSTLKQLVMSQPVKLL